MGEAAFRISLNPSSNVPIDSSMYSSSQSSQLHLSQYIIPFLLYLIHIFGVTSIFLSVLLLLEYVCMHTFQKMF